MLFSKNYACKTCFQLAILNRESETQLLWKIDNWEAKMNEAKSGKRPILNSVPFFTGKHQYKLSLCLLPYGDKGGEKLQA